MSNPLIDALNEDIYRNQLFNNKNISNVIKNNDLDGENNKSDNDNYDHTLDYIGLGCFSLIILALLFSVFLINIYYPIKHNGFINFIKQNCYCCYCCNCCYFNNNISDTASIVSSNDNYSLYSYDENRVIINNVINNLQIVIIGNEDNDGNNNGDDDDNDYNDNGNDNGNNICSICLNNLKEVDSDIICLKCCKHKFCKKPCLEGWIEEKINNPTCPLCRAPLAD